MFTKCAKGDGSTSHHAVAKLSMIRARCRLKNVGKQSYGPANKGGEEQFRHIDAPESFPHRLRWLWGAVDTIELPREISNSCHRRGCCNMRFSIWHTRDCGTWGRTMTGVPFRIFAEIFRERIRPRCFEKRSGFSICPVQKFRNPESLFTKIAPSRPVHLIDVSP